MQTRSLSLIRDNKSTAAHTETHTHHVLKLHQSDFTTTFGHRKRTRKEKRKKRKSGKETMVEKQLKERASFILPGAAKWVLLFAVLMPERGVQVQGQTCTDAADTSDTVVDCYRKGLTAVPAFINPDADYV